jgi:NAD-dependent dihydropyrimidine dehydrogenase PreA subunit
MLYSVRMTEPSRCDRLGGCVQVCPEGIWRWGRLSGYRFPVPVGQERCVGCMRCVRICPQKIIVVEPR